MATWYVSPTGSDSASGTSRNAAFRTIYHACTQNQLAPGDEIRVMPGLHTAPCRINSSNSISGTAAAPIMLTADNQSDLPKIRVPPIINDKGQRQGRPQLELEDLSHWRVDHLQFDKYSAGGGVHVVAESKNVTNVYVQNCRFIEQKPGQAGRNHVILLSVDKQGFAITDCSVNNNYLYKCWPVYPIYGNECITFIGNVSHSEMVENNLDQCYGIGINLIGVGSGSNNRGQPSKCLMARNRVNVIIDPKWVTNGRPRGTAIYNDRAGANNVIEDNIAIGGAYVNALAINVEPLGFAGLDDPTGTIARNNILLSDYHSNAIKIGVGGTAADTQEYKYNLQHPIIAHNVIIQRSPDENGQTVLLTRSRHLRIINNIILRRTNGGFVLNPSAFVGAQDQSTWAADGNLWHSIGTPKWRWISGGAQYTSFAAYQSGSGQDANGQYANPTFTDESSHDYTLASGSAGEGDAIPLTYANGAGTSSTTLTVDNARFFSSGNRLTGGDTIYIGTPGSGVERTVTQVDYANNRITLATAATWADNAEIHYKYSGVAPSVGLTATVSTVGPDKPEPEPEPEPEPDDELTDLLANYDFASGIDPWLKASLGTATATVSAGKLNVTVANSAGNTQVYQSGFAIDAGREYTLTITHQSSASSYSVGVFVHEHAGDFANLGLADTISVTTSETTSTFTWTATASSSNARIRLWFPTTGANTLYFDQVRLTYGVDAPPAETGTSIIRIAAGADDGYWRPGSTAFDNWTANTLWVGENSADGYERSSVFRFVLDQDWPDTYNYIAANLSIYADGTPTGSGHSIDIYIEDAADPAAIASGTDAEGRTWSAGPTAWTPTITANTWYQTPDFTSALDAHITKYGGLSAGDAIIIRLRDPGAEAANRGARFESYEGSMAAVGNDSRAAILTVSWSAATHSADRVFAETFVETFAETWSA